MEIDFLESYDRNALVGELQRIAKVLRKDNLSRRDIDDNGRMSSAVVLKRFGSLRKALQEAGLTPARFNKATDEELYSILVELWTRTLEACGRSPYRTELERLGYPVSGDTFVRRFGSWNKALLAAARYASADAEQPTSPATATQQTKSESRKTLSVRKRFLVFKRDHYKCRICGRSGVQLEVDHVVPWDASRSDALDNLQTLCFECNRGKRNTFE